MEEDSKVCTEHAKECTQNIKGQIVKSYDTIYEGFWYCWSKPLRAKHSLFPQTANPDACDFTGKYNQPVNTFRWYTSQSLNKLRTPEDTDIALSKQHFIIAVMAVMTTTERLYSPHHRIDNCQSYIRRSPTYLQDYAVELKMRLGKIVVPCVASPKVKGHFHGYVSKGQTYAVCQLSSSFASF